MNAFESTTAPLWRFGQSKLTASVPTVPPEAVLWRSTTVVFVDALSGVMRGRT
jgi:hypothetical protein